MTSRKGISPLVAVVMLIAFTLLVAGILGSLVTQFAREQRDIFQYCTGARVLLLSGVENFDASSGLSNVTFSVQNFGNVDLIFNILQTYKNGTVTKVGGFNEIEAADVGQITIPNINVSDSAEFTIQAEECPGAQDFIRAASIKRI